MPIFIMFGKHTQDSLKDVSVQRTKKAVKIIEKNGGKVISMYVVMGEHDLVLTLDFPDAEKAMCASMGLKLLTGISFSTSPVVDVEKFDSLISKMEKI
ncbi:MAG: GYD domain-containing protein [Prolixibacteraceae bacterium]|nr:GYD domain-containing protein [Prolixibacteraceae bacterium]